MVNEKEIGTDMVICKEINDKLKKISLEISNICFSDNIIPLMSIESVYSLQLKIR